MKRSIFSILLFCPLLLFCQNIRWELSAQVFSSINALTKPQSAISPQIQYTGLRLGVALNKTSDIQFGLRYQSRVDYVQTSLLTQTRRAPRRRICPDQAYFLSNSGYEMELQFRIRNNQFSRVHLFWGAGLAWLFAPDIHIYDQRIEQITITRPNGESRILECGIPQGYFEGVELAMIFAPGLRVRLTHRIHTELESQLRYNPMHPLSRPVIGCGLNVVYNFY